MDVLSRLIGSTVALVFIAAAFVSLFNPRQGFTMLKKLGMILLGVILGTALFQHLSRLFVEGANPSWLLILILLSPVAYFIRESRRQGKRGSSEQPRGAERTPVMPNHHMQDDD